LEIKIIRAVPFSAQSSLIMVKSKIERRKIREQKRRSEGRDKRKEEID